MSATGRAGTRHAGRRAFTLLEVMIVIAVIITLTTLVLGVGSALLRNAERSQVESAMNIMESALNEYEAQLGRPMTFNGAFAPSDQTGANPVYPPGIAADAWGGALAGLVPPSCWRRPEALFDVRDPGFGTGGPTSGPSMWAWRAKGVGVFVVGALRQVDSVRPILAGIPSGILRPEPPTSAFPPVDLPQAPGSTIRYLPSARFSLGGTNTSRSEFVDPWSNRIAFVFPGRSYRFGADSGLGLPDADGTVRTPYESALGVCTNRRICLVSAGPDGLFGLDGEGGSLNGNTQAAVTARLSAAADNVYLYPLDPPQ